MKKVLIALSSFIACAALPALANEYKIPSFQAAIAGFDATIETECGSPIYIVKLWDVLEWKDLGWYAFGPPNVQHYRNPYTGLDDVTSADGFNQLADALIRHIGLWNNPVRLFFTGHTVCGGKYQEIAPVVAYDSQF